MGLLDVLLFASPNGYVDTDFRRGGFTKSVNKSSKRLANAMIEIWRDIPMPAYAPFYVEIKTDDDNEMIPCADLETAEYCMSVLKRYGFKGTELHLLGEIKEDYNGRAVYDFHLVDVYPCRYFGSIIMEVIYGST